MPKFQISSIQKFPIESDLVLLPISSGWSMMFLSNQSLPSHDFLKSTPQSMVLNYKLKPKSAYSIYTNQGYTNLKIRGVIELPVGDPSWLSVGSDWFPVTNYTSLNQSQYKDISFVISPPLTVSQGVHNAKVKFHIEGFRNSITHILSTYEIPVVLNVFEEGYYYSPNNFTFYYASGSTQSQVLKIGGDNWRVNIPLGLTLTGSNVAQNPDGSFYAVDSGLKNFNLGIAANIDQLLGDNSSIVLPVTVVYTTGSYTIPVTIIQAGKYYPTKTNFSIQNGQVDKLFQMINLTRNDDYTVIAPANIGYELLNASSGKKIKLFVLDPDGFGSGVFNLNLSIIYPDATYIVQITVNVGNQFDLGLDFSTVFTHSMQDLVFSTNNEGSYINMILSVLGNENRFTYQFPFFKNRAAKNIGKALSNFVDYENSTLGQNEIYLSNFERSFPLNYFNLNITERKSDVELLNFNKLNVSFVLGYKPVVKNNVAILQHNNFSRFTANSFALISVYSLTGFFDYKIMKNNIEVASAVQAFGYIRILKLDFSLYNAIAGDVFDFIIQPGIDEIKKSFVIFPEAVESINVVYLDSFGLYSCLNFTGNTKNVASQFSFKMENYLNKTYLNTRKHIEKETSTILLNTGFLLKSQNLEVSELMKSQKAWVIINDQEIIELIPKTEKIEEESNDDFLYSFAIEFEINKEKYAQGYNF